MAEAAEHESNDFSMIFHTISETASRKFNLPVITRYVNAKESKSQLIISPPPERDLDIQHLFYRDHGVNLIEFFVVAGDLSCHLKVLGLPYQSDSLLSEQRFTRSNDSSGEDWMDYLQLELDSTKLKFYLEGLQEKFKVCEGRGQAITTGQDNRSSINMRNAVQKGLKDGNFITFPDGRYRSFNCQLLVDEKANLTNENSTKCSSCLEPSFAVPVLATTSSPKKCKNL